MINKKGFPFLKAPDGNALPKIPPINPANIPREEIWIKKVIYVLNLYIMLNKIDHKLQNPCCFIC